MPAIKKIEVKESISSLKKLHKQSSPHLQPRLQMLILSQQKDLHSKYALADALGVNFNSVQTWKTTYLREGLEGLLKDKRGGKKKPVIDPATDEAIRIRLSEPMNAPRSYVELQQWVDEQYIKGINYHTLNKHVKRKYKAKIKVARRSHVSKDAQAAEAFKKNQ
jgi:transposase